ncbi:MAG TPA: hypothetical protein VGK48_11420, partial [Terriglobia bacterium]
MKSIVAFLVLFLAASAVFISQVSQTVPLNDPVTKLSRQIDRGEAALDYSSGGWGYLPSLLKHLDLDIDSQILVFSKTSFQLTRISPKTPRALFFNDNVSVGSVQNGTVFELISADPVQGLIY